MELNTLVIGFAALVATAVAYMGWRKSGQCQQAIDDMNDLADDLDAARHDLRAAKAAIEIAKNQYEDSGESMVEAREDMDDATAILQDVGEELEKANAMMTDLNPPDTDPVGAEGYLMANFATWQEDGDQHFAQVTAWVQGGGIDVQLGINGGAATLPMTWKELDLLASLAARLRPHDPKAPPVGGMKELAHTGEGPDCGRSGCPRVDGKCPACDTDEAERRESFDFYGDDSNSDTAGDDNLWQHLIDADGKGISPADFVMSKAQATKVDCPCRDAGKECGGIYDRRCPYNAFEGNPPETQTHKPKYKRPATKSDPYRPEPEL
jgi:hypothetical protein